jgi:lambda family phage portal protein
MAATKRLQIGKGTLDIPWNALDRAIEAFSPRWAGKRLQARVGHALAAQAGGGYHGASSSRRSLAGWNPLAADADSDTLADLPALRARSRDMVRNAPVAGGALNTEVTHVVGSGLSLQCAIDAQLLGLSNEEADAWHQDTERKFNAWFETTACDITRTQNGYGLQDLAYRSELESGDVCVVLTQAPWAKGPVKLALQLVEADRLSNPDRHPDTANLVAGVELDDNGAPLRYHFANGNPHARSGRAARRKLDWAAVEAFGRRTGRRNVLHLFRRIRPGQTRGIPMLAPVIEPLKQLERYTEAELMAAVVSGMFTVFIETEGSTTLQPSALEGGNGGASADGWDGKLGNGLVVELNKGEKINSANPGRPNALFDPFVASIIRQIGMLLQIPYEVLVKHYTSSYTAARAAMLDAWRHFRGRRSHLADDLCQPVYAAWLDEAVAAGYVQAKGYYGSELVRRAWQGALWIGDGPGVLDPAKEIDAAERRVALTISTLEAESVLHDGGKWRSKLRQRQREQLLLQRSGLQPAAPAPAPTAPPQGPEAPRPDGTDNDDETP